MIEKNLCDKYILHVQKLYKFKTIIECERKMFGSFPTKCAKTNDNWSIVKRPDSQKQWENENIKTNNVIVKNRDTGKEVSNQSFELSRCAQV